MKREYCGQRNPKGMETCKYCGAPLPTQKPGSLHSGGYSNDFPVELVIVIFPLILVLGVVFGSLCLNFWGY